MIPNSNNDDNAIITQKPPSAPKSNPFFANEERSGPLTLAQPMIPQDLAQKQQQIRSSSVVGGKFDPTPENLISKARVVIATDLGIQDPSVLSDDDNGSNQFLWIRPLADKPLGRIDFVAAGKFFNLRGAFPNLDWRAHDFRIDVNDPSTVRCTVRPVGTMTQQLRLRNKVVPPTGKIWRGPPESISMTFDPKNGKVVKLCSEFVIDRQCGNTNGLCGVKAAAFVAGVPPNDFEIYPALVVIDRFFARSLEPLDEPTTFLAPFPETVMITLAKGVLFANLGIDDASLLSENFQFLSPTIGPVGKNRFLTSYAADQFGDFRSDYQFTNYRVDPYDPYRVWVDVKLLGGGLEGPPLAYSFTFDDDGYCTRITGGAVLDSSIGNTGGLPGVDGIRYALGAGSSDIYTRPLPVALGRLRKTILSPLTKINADDLILKPIERDGKTKVSLAIAKEGADGARKRVTKLNEEKKEAESRPSTKDPKFFPMQPAAQPPVPPLKPETRKKLFDLTSFKIPPIEFSSIAQFPKGVGVPKTKTDDTNEQQDLNASKRQQNEVKARAAALEKEGQQKIDATRKADDERRRQVEETEKRQEDKRLAIAKKNAEDRRRKAEEETKTRAERSGLDERPGNQSSLPRPSLSISIPRPSFPINKITVTKADQSKSKPKQSPQTPSIALSRPYTRLTRKRDALPAQSSREGKLAKKTAMDELKKAKAGVTLSLSVLFGLDRSLEGESSSYTDKPTNTLSPRKVVQPLKVLPKQAQKIGTQSSSSSLPSSSSNQSPPEVSNQPTKRPTFSLSDLFATTTSGSTTTKATTNRQNTTMRAKDAKSKSTAKNVTDRKLVVKKNIKAASPKKKENEVVVGNLSVNSLPLPATIKSAPNGVPKIVNWRRNKDRSVTGFIKGSKSFNEGEKVTTSPIADGVIRRGELVITISGSKYLLQ